MSQDKIFFAKEGDSWFRRNKDDLGKMDEKHDPVVSLIDMYGIKPKRVMEVGASNGWRLELLRKRYGSSCVGVEPSQEAITDAKKRFPEVTIERGLASEIPSKEKFDLVVVNFVLHWVPREELLRSIAEIDRVVAEGGFLIVGDFLPDHPAMTNYHHLPGENVFTFKLDYANIFTATELYRTVARVTLDHDHHRFDPNTKDAERAAVTLLRKSLKDQYLPPA